MSAQKSSNPVDDLIASLEEMASYMEVAGENDFKIRAYRMAAGALRKSVRSRADLQAVANGDVKLVGVGEGTKKNIQDFLERGHLPALDEIKAKIPGAVMELLKVPGLGPKKAHVIYEELGVQSLGELEYACRENRLLNLKGFGPGVQKKILDSLENLKLRQDQKTLGDAFEVAHEFMHHLVLHKKIIDGVTFVGALGRGAEVVKNFEFALWPQSQKVLQHLETLSWDQPPHIKKQKIFQEEVTLVSGHLQNVGYVLLWCLSQPLTKHVEFFQQWLYADDDLKPILEDKSKSFQGWEFSWLESSWEKRKPHAQAYRRAQHGGVKGIFHNHTIASDGAASLEEVVREAERLGFEYIGISDHSQSAFYAHGLKAEELRAQKIEIEKLQKKFSIRIFHGVESDILQDGSLDYPASVLKDLDFVIGSIHSRFQMTEPEMTKRIVKALKNPAMTMWGHPTGRLLLSRKPYLFNWSAIFDAAQEHHVVIELNANPDRLDIDWRWGAELEKRKIPLCVNPDAHSLEGLQHTRLGELMAEKTMVPQSLVLNLKTVNEMETFLWDRKKKNKLG